MQSSENKDELELERIAKRMLTMPHRPRDESKLGKSKPPKKPKHKRKKANKARTG